MPKLPRISGQEVIKVLEHMDFQKVRQKGSHVILKKKTSKGDIGCVIPLHKELAIGTLRGILRQAKVTNVDFLNNL